MFTGIIEEVGAVRSLRGQGSQAHLMIEARRVVEDLAIGDSIAVNGACLTVTQVMPTAFAADVSRETLRVTNLGTLQARSGVNLERALRLADRLGGHLVQGHIDDTAAITGIQRDGDTLLLTVAMPETLRRYIVPKGSIAIDGVSLTVNACEASHFTCTIIPHTVNQTTLRFRKVGDRVNLESDILGRYVEQLLHSPPGTARTQRGIDYAMLQAHGW
ncbi:riboflavin synthase [candidate division KSB3 bacterium]|uniref:Riboflavin synthase n=1 Tax=candidate division KSB3 bacterium TaxID=2044937 RepID=A0A9D5JVC1_9BACT|nr:riboflavin synthase [candidate division KSB3 bacterium]MBD3324939.1 riboflavin synthase [candidate division KSB3 bacterium]